jgi:hypothetical protein
MHLGCVRITIDDLAELMTLVKKPDQPEPLKVRFDGGYFTKAEELSKLTDIEMRSLRLKTSTVEVILSSSSALAIGERKEAENIYNWAHMRQIRCRLRPVQMLTAIPHQLALTVVTGLLGLSITISEFNEHIHSIRDFIIIGAASVFSVLAGVFIWRQLPRKQSSYAVIIAMSRDQHRQLIASQVYSRRSWIVAIVSAVIAALAAAAAVWVKVTSK